jgi:TolB protein
LRLYVAPAGRFEVVEFAPRGARPLEWSADRTRLLFSAASRDRLQLFEWHAASGEVRQLTRGEWAHPDGCYGPDGALAYVEVSARKGGRATSRIWIQRPGEPARPVTEGPTDDQPSWSGAAGRLVYVASDPKRGELLRWVDPASGEGGALTRGRAPVFTPDGAWIVYSARSAGDWKLWRMRADGSGKRNFGKSAFHENDPTVSPDGRFVLFAGTKQERSATSRLFVRPLDGSPDRQLGVSGSALLPVW